jgi:hypothetical protein
LAVTTPIRDGDAQSLKEALSMTTMPVPGSSSVPRVSPEAISRGRVALILGVTVVLAVAVYYLVGVDEGMTSVFGNTMVVHEWVHDSRHLLGFPCH